MTCEAKSQRKVIFAMTHSMSCHEMKSCKIRFVTLVTNIVILSHFSNQEVLLPKPHHTVLVQLRPFHNITPGLKLRHMSSSILHW